ncbi:amidase [Nocardia otitidiscaviarum]|uniref:amidase n=1 Tax=Nocardia otitidiscaviarum TaxID=1823 RepID=UPI001894A0E0|nr:amidase [Nocardia otitidiscaviarum]MBF6181751.1 amidase [Nocardia otitidiscaviarum]
MKNNRVHTFKDDALADLDACGVATRIASGEVSAREVVEAAIARAHDADPILRGLATEDFDRALSAGDHRGGGAFGGVPTAIKDNTALAGLPTQFGSTAFRAAPASANGHFVDQMVRTGMIPIGKTRLPEFAFNVTCEYTRDEPVRNPWNTDYSAGGSSGGAAALVAAGVVPIAHATDAGGSIRIPAAACGLVGLKPSRGRLVEDVSEKAMPLRIAVQGVLTRSVRDTARMMFEAERRYRNARLRPVCDVAGSSRTRLRIGVLSAAPTPSPVDSETRESIRLTADLLDSLGHHVTAVAVPVRPDFMRDYLLYMGLLMTSIRSAATRIVGSSLDRAELEATTSGLCDRYRRASLRTPIALHRLREVQKRFRSTFDHVDVLLSPAVAHSTPILGHLSPDQPFDSWFERLSAFDCYAPLNNISGTPAITLPLHRTRSGLPLASHFSANIGDERTLLELAFELEEAMPWARIDNQPQPIPAPDEVGSIDAGRDTARRPG